VSSLLEQAFQDASAKTEKTTPLTLAPLAVNDLETAFTKTLPEMEYQHFQRDNQEVQVLNGATVGFQDHDRMATSTEGVVSLISIALQKHLMITDHKIPPIETARLPLDTRFSPREILTTLRNTIDIHGRRCTILAYLTHIVRLFL
jgi:hypothetical protein